MVIDPAMWRARPTPVVNALVLAGSLRGSGLALLAASL